MATPPYSEARHAPANEGAAIDLSGGDATINPASRGIYVGVTGNVKVDLDKTGTAIVFKNAQQGSVLPIQVKKVYQIGTTATDLVALY